MRAIITGAAGFVGSHLTEYLLKTTDWELILIDKLTYASNGMSRLKDIQVFDQYHNRVVLLSHDISIPFSVGMEKEIGSVDYIFHLAAETHVDRSIADPRPFVQSNIVGTMEMLQLARKFLPRLRVFLMFGTDEEFGPCYEEAPPFTEWSRFNPTNPYSASKAAADSLALAWSNTYNIPVICTKCMNCFGERQHPEKFIPAAVRKILRGELLLIHSDFSRTKPGSRTYIHARTASAAVKFIADTIKPSSIGMRDKFNIKGEMELDNLSLVKKIHGLLEKILERKFDLRTELVDFHSDRPGHDLRYALNGGKLEHSGWVLPKTFDESLEQTIRWMVEPKNLHWLLLE